MFASLTLVPALLAFGGARLTRGKTFGGHDADKTTLGARWVAIVMRRPLIAAGLVIVALGALAIPALNVRLGLPNDGSSNPDTTQRQAYDLVSEGFGVGVNGQLTVVARGDAEATAEDARHAAGRRRRLARPGHPGPEPRADLRHAVQRPVDARPPRTWSRRSATPASTARCS